MEREIVLLHVVLVGLWAGRASSALRPFETGRRFACYFFIEADTGPDVPADDGGRIGHLVRLCRD